LESALEEEHLKKIITLVYSFNGQEIKRDFPGRIEPKTKIKTRKELEEELNNKDEKINDIEQRSRSLEEQKTKLESELTLAKKREERLTLKIIFIGGIGFVILVY